MNNIIAIGDGRVTPDDVLKSYAREMHTMLRAVLNIMRSREVAIRGTEVMLAMMIETLLDTIEIRNSAQGDPPAPTPPRAS